jgi:UDP-N-acetylmuramoylalanine--D-glutamate ligase
MATNAGGLDALGTCDIVLKSPGIPRRRADVESLAAQVHLTSALEVWLAGTDRGRVIAVTGTKGKSTTTALIDFFLRCAGKSSRPAGNIGAPPYDTECDDAEWTVLEVSSFQAVDLIEAPGVVVVTSLGSDHLDWHGSLSLYHRDKLSLTHTEGHHLTIIPDDPTLLLRRDEMGGDITVATGLDEELAAALGLVGRHNARNVTVALTAVARALHADIANIRQAALAAADQFTPLPGRLTLVHQSDGVEFIDDGLATTPLATAAALESLADRHVVLLVGGFDRGVDYRELFAAAAAHGSVEFVTTGPAGARIAETAPPSLPLTRGASFDDAVRQAVRRMAGREGVVLLSPGAPSFDEFANWSERSAAFLAAVTRE